MRKKLTFILLVLFVLSLLEASFFHVNFVLLITLCLLLLQDDEFAAISAFSGGIILDLLSNSNFGLFTLSLSLVVAFFIFSQKFMSKNIIFLVVVSLVLMLFYQYAVSFPSFYVKNGILKVIFLDFVFLVLLFPFVRWINEFFAQSSIRRNR